MPHALSRTELLLGKAALERLAACRVAVFGLGGVGGSCAEALARAGVGALDLVDDDVVSLSNLNRQVVATTRTLKMPKAEAMAERVREVAPGCLARPVRCFYLPETADAFNLADYDYVVDCVDTVTAKLFLVQQAHNAGTPIICAMGAANKLDPTRFRVCDISETHGDRLARIIRKECRKRGIGRLKVVYSDEPTRAIAPEAMAAALAEEELAHPSRHGIPGSVSWVPPVAGYILAGAVVRDLTGV